MNRPTSFHLWYPRFTQTEALVIGLVMLVLFAILIGMCPCSCSKSSERGRRVTCAGNLKVIGLATLMYSGDYAGYFMLTPLGGRDWRPADDPRYLQFATRIEWACPSAPVKLTSAAASNYLYYGSGLKDGNGCATSTVIGFDASGNHPDDQWMNALFIDGHAEGAKPDGTKLWNRNTHPPPPTPTAASALPPSNEGVITP